MKILNKFDDYMVDIILEKIKFDEIILVMSDTLKNILSGINHPIARKMLQNSNINSFKSKVTLLDADISDDNKLDNILFTTSAKTIEILIKDYYVDLNDKYSIDSDMNSHIFGYLNHFKNDMLEKGKNRSVTSLGKIINKLFPNEFPASGNPGNDIESFVNEYKAKVVKNKTFELVDGDDIIYWYSMDNYNQNGGTLNNSCMKYDDCEDYLYFYKKNKSKVSLLILKDGADENKIRGRALVWKLDIPEGRYFMDRIYTVYDSDIKLFTDYATKEGWLYKKRQSYTDKTIIDPKSNTEDVINLTVKNMYDTGEYPFMDSLIYYNGVDLSNQYETLGSKDLIKLQDTDGSFIKIGIWVDFYKEYIIIENNDEYKECAFIWEYRHNDDCFFSKYYGYYIAYDYAIDNGIICDYPEGQDEWRKKGDYVTLYPSGKTATKEYTNLNCRYSSYEKKWLEEFVYSNVYNTYISPDKAVKVYNSADKKSTDWRPLDDDETWWVAWDGNYYDEHVQKDKIKE